MHPLISNVFCSYPYDGIQKNYKCDPPGKSDQCTPGCRKTACTSHRDWECSYNAPQLASMLTMQQERHSGDHNEVILDSFHIRQNLPNSIQAIFYLSTSVDSERSRIKKMHEEYLEEWHLSVATFPLLMLDLDAHSEPFTEVKN